MLLNIRGFSLAETLVAVSLVSVTILVAIFLAITFYRYQQQNIGNVDSEVSLLTASRDLHRALSMAADISATAASLDGISLPGGEGRVRDYFADVMGPVPGKIDTVAVFLREVGGSAVPVVSQFIPTAIFYARPTPRTSGVLFIDAKPAGGPLMASYSSQFYDKIVEFYVSNFYYTRGVLTSAEFSITARRFLDSDTSKWNFCPQKDINNSVAGCVGVPTAPYRDVTYKARVTFSNQVVRSSSPTSWVADAPYERLMGNIYLFPQR